MKKFPFINVLVLGLGESGLAAAEMLLRLGCRVKVSDRQSSQEVLEKGEFLRQRGAQVFLGDESLSNLAGAEILIVSPGVPKSNQLVVEAKKWGIPVWSEVELAYFFFEQKEVQILGVTGTNGKTTTTELAGRMLKEAGLHVVVGGNIGLPLTRCVDLVEKGSILVTELSSFQLEHIEKFRSHVAVVLNIAQDHLDWHPSFSDYVEAKSRILLNQRKEDYAILNKDDPNVWSFSAKAVSQVIPFSKKPLSEGVYLKEGAIWFSWNSFQKEKIVDVSEVRFKGIHNYENLMAASAAALLFGANLVAIREAAKDFEGLPHRIEYVGKFKGVDYYDDSKATNPDAVKRAVEAFSSPLLLLLGGKNKGNDFHSLAREIKGKVRNVIVFGEASEEIWEAFSKEDLSLERARGLEEAVKKAKELAKEGDVVLLSPGCASFDEFTSYAERGDYFQRLVRVE
jgi:UDP-N-acetylmuramoylalanine--D-glutamate ligase